MVYSSTVAVGDRPASSSIPPTAAYLHIPFCRRRCYYCDFPVVVVGDRPPLARQGQTAYGAIEQYLPVLQREITATPNLGAPLQTVFFGGGTPSLLTDSQLIQLLDTLAHQFDIESDAECSIEVDPDTVSLEQLAGYANAGINRFSLGVQAFQPELLSTCGRTHTPEDIETAIAQIQQVGVTNFSLDLISGLPHQTMAQWIESLEKAIALEPTHISVYDLIVEPMTAFARWYEPGRSPLPSDETAAAMYRATSNILAEAGFEHYEISNYAKPGYQCQHNRVYWENRPYYGFGMGAASYIHGQRFTRPRKRQDYFAWVQSLTDTPSTVEAAQSPSDRLLDTVMLGLRLAEGLDLQTVALDFGTANLEQLLSAVAPFQERDWVTLDSANLGEITSRSSGRSRQASRLRLTDPEGFLFSNVVLSAIFKAFMDEQD